MRHVVLAILLALTAAPLAAQGGAPPPTTPPPSAPPAISIRVDGEVPHPYTLTAADLRTMDRVEVSASTDGAPAARFEGVPLSAILERAGAGLDTPLRAERLASYVLIEADDGSRAVFAMAELDPTVRSSVIILADRVNGAPLPPEDAPARIVISDDARPARWVRQVTRIRLLIAP